MKRNSFFATRMPTIRDEALTSSHKKLKNPPTLRWKSIDKKSKFKLFENTKKKQFNRQNGSFVDINNK